MAARRCCTKRDEGLSRRLVSSGFQIRAVALHNEAIVRDGEIRRHDHVGQLRHHLGGAIGLGYVACQGESAADVLASAYEIESPERGQGRGFAEADVRPEGGAGAGLKRLPPYACRHFSPC